MRPCRHPIAQPRPSPLLPKRLSSRRSADCYESELPIVSLVSPCAGIVLIAFRLSGLMRPRIDIDGACRRRTIQTARPPLLFPEFVGPENKSGVRLNRDRGRLTELLGTQFTLQRTTRTPVQNNRVLDNRVVHSCARGYCSP